MSKSLTILFCLLNLSAYAQNENEKAFLSDTVRFTGRDNHISFSGTLTRPKHLRSFPTVVMVSGTGKQDRNGTMAGHRIFHEIATYLAQNGIGMLRTDDRGVGNTGGIYEKATTEDFAMDALSAVEYLRSRGDIDVHKIGLMGHSEGGMAIAIAASKSKDVHFLVSLSGLASNGLDAQIRQNQDIVAASSMPDYDKRRSNQINKLMFEVAHRYAKSDSLEAKLNDAYAKWKTDDEAYFKSLNMGYDHFRFPIYSYVQNAIGPWYRYLIAYDARAVISKISIPVLAINGDKDLMVAADENLGHWRSYALSGGNNKVTTIKLHGLNHLLISCLKCDMAEMPTLQTGFSSVALQVIKKWIDKTVR